MPIALEKVRKYRDKLLELVYNRDNLDTSDREKAEAALDAISFIEESQGELQEAIGSIKRSPIGKFVNSGLDLTALAAQYGPMILVEENRHLICSDQAEDLLKLIKILADLLTVPIPIIIPLLVFLIEEAVDNFCEES